MQRESVPPAHHRHTLMRRQGGLHQLSGAAARRGCVTLRLQQRIRKRLLSLSNEPNILSVDDDTPDTEAAKRMSHRIDSAEVPRRMTIVTRFRLVAPYCHS